MRKILGLWGAMVLSTTLSTSVTACGSTNPKPSLSPIAKVDLKTKITALKTNHIIKIDPSQTYQMLDSKIMIAEQISDLTPHLQNPTIKYFSDDQAKIDITNQKQKAGDLYVVITADINDANYQGSTNPLKISL
ncbi:hypothetical protein [Spiroplasma endosymbiont of Polydrusus pterygomalis]|uniref:hypothetical protein n=1 Tax=Spiroplasma endosymbiont of Polydrusus pterygomalis TaxID=3139327 RepID=UPI003CCAB9B4